jgi:carbon monoxide dehydrogenase subunit G
MRVDTSITINRPMEEVFDYAADPAHVAEYVVPVIDCRKTSDGPLGKGTTATSTVRVLGRQFEVPSETTEWDRPHGFSVHNTGGPMPMTMQFRFSPDGEATRVDLRADVEVARLLQIASPLIEPVVDRQMRASLDSLKAIMESQVPATAGGDSG